MSPMDSFADESKLLNRPNWYRESNAKAMLCARSILDGNIYPVVSSPYPFTPKDAPSAEIVDSRMALIQRELVEASNYWLDRIRAIPDIDEIEHLSSIAGQSGGIVRTHAITCRFSDRTKLFANFAQLYFPGEIFNLMGRDGATTGEATIRQGVVLLRAAQVDFLHSVKKNCNVYDLVLNVSLLPPFSQRTENIDYIRAPHRDFPVHHWEVRNYNLLSP